MFAGGHLDIRTTADDTHCETSGQFNLLPPHVYVHVTLAELPPFRIERFYVCAVDEKHNAQFSHRNHLVHGRM